LANDPLRILKVLIKPQNFSHSRVPLANDPLRILKDKNYSCLMA